MAAGRPIVASDLPAIREVLAHERERLLVEPGDPQALTAAIRRGEGRPGARRGGSARQARAGRAATTRGIGAPSGSRRCFREVARAMISPAAARGSCAAPTAAARLRARPTALVCCGRAATGSTDRRAASSTCVRTPRSRSGRSTWTRRCTPTRGTSACRRRSSARRSATTCCARSSRPAPRIASSISGAAAAARSLWNRDWGATAVGIDISPFFAAEARARRRSAARRSAAAAVRRRHVHESVLARRAGAPVARGAARRCWPRRRACSRPAAHCSSTRTSGKNAPHRARAALDQRAGAAARSRRARRSPAGTAAQVGSPEPARATSPSSSGWSARRRVPDAADPLLHAARRRRSSRTSSMRMAETRLADRRVAPRRRGRGALRPSGGRAQRRRARPAKRADRRTAATRTRALRALIVRDEARPPAVRTHPIRSVLRAARKAVTRRPRDRIAPPR